MNFQWLKIWSFCVLILCFSGQAVSAAESFELQARFSASVVFSSLPEAEVKRLIGRGDLQLDAGVREIAIGHYAIPVGHYPIIFIQGVQSDMTDMNGNIFVVGGRPVLSYQESIFMIPRVQFQGKSFNYMRRLYLDRAIAVMVGKQKHGYDKMLGDFALETGESREDALTKFNGVTVAEFKSDPSSVLSGLDAPALFASLIGENFISLPAAGGVICTRQAVQVVKNSLYPIRAKVVINKGYFNDGTIDAGGADLLYALDGEKSSLKLVYDWKLTAPDVGCKL